MHTVSHIKTNGNNDRYGSNIVIMYSVFFLSGFKEKKMDRVAKIHLKMTLRQDHKKSIKKRCID